MATRNYTRLIAYLVYLTVVFGILLWVYLRLTHFDATLRLEAGQSEHMLYTPAGDAGSRIVARQALPADVIPFEIDSTARYLSNEQNYLARPLPFSLGLSPSSEQSVRFKEQLVETGSNVVHVIESGRDVPAQGARIHVLGFSPWQGLAPSPRGVKCAALMVASSDNPLGQSIQLEVDRWALLDEHLALGLHWHTSEAAAREAAEAQTRPDLRAAWWTVKDGEGAIRSTSFLPGAGTECTDGSVWTVERLDAPGAPARPTLQVLVQEKTGQRIESIPANDRSGDSRVRFHHPGAAATLLVLHAWRENEAIYAKMEGNASTPVTGPAQSQAIPIADGRRLWVTQVLPYALPLPERGPAVQQVVLEEESGQRTYLREGGRAVIAGNEYSYRREPIREIKALQLEIIPPAPDERRTTSLPPGEVLSVGEWRFSLLDSNTAPRDPNGVYLRASYAPFTPGRSLGLALFLIGSYGWVIIRFLPRKEAADTRPVEDDSPAQ